MNEVGQFAGIERYHHLAPETSLPGFNEFLNDHACTSSNVIIHFNDTGDSIMQQGDGIVFPLDNSQPSSSSSRKRKRSSASDSFKCSFCPKKFPNQSLLNTHSADCQLSRTHSCDICGKRFKAKGGLQQHQRSHLQDEDRPYQCSYCQKRFNQKSHVDQHERIHTGDKPFLCQYCGRGFRQRSQQLGHESTHTSGNNASTSSLNPIVSSSYPATMVQPHSNIGTSAHNSSFSSDQSSGENENVPNFNNNLFSVSTNALMNNTAYQLPQQQSIDGTGV